MTTEYDEHNLTGLDNFKLKLKSIDYDFLIDKYLTTQNLIISGGILLFFILLMAMIFIIRYTSDNIVEIEVSKLEVFEKSINDLRQQQQFVHKNLEELISTVQSLNEINKVITVDSDKQSSKDKLLPDLLAEEVSLGILDDENRDLTNTNSIDSDRRNALSHVGTQEKRILTMKDKFNSERVDLDWKNKNEVKIIDTLEKSKFEKTWFENLECRSTICELVVTHINKFDSDNFTTDIITELDDFTVRIYSEKNNGGKFKLSLSLKEKNENIEINTVLTDESKKNYNKKVKKIVLRIEDKFKQESIDNRWRKLIEFKIKTVLDQRKFKKTWFDQLLCKTSVCRLVVTHKKKSTSNAFIKEFPLTLGEFEKKKATVKKSKNGNYKTTMYLQQRVEKTKKAKIKT